MLGLIALAVALCVAFASVTQAQGSGKEDSSTIGIGSQQASNSASLSTEDRLNLSSEESSDSVVDENGVMTVSEVTYKDASDFTATKQRSITVKDPDPVVVPVAVDYDNPTAVEKAKQVCTLDPLPTAPHVSPDVNDGTWSCGKASAYCIATNDDGAGNFGVSTTASGRALSNSGITVAVPASQSYLLGRIVEICYDGKVVIATVTDTGGFGIFGRSLDLAPGIINAFGYSSVSDWGVRSVYYRFL
ncbi:MAG: hypothetical protein ACI4BI_06280 [Anaerotardibacter sp.]